MYNLFFNKQAMSKKNIIEKITREVEDFLHNDLPRIASQEAVNEFRDNFSRQGFRNKGIRKWPDVKRRDPTSPWYGFQYKGERRDRNTKRKSKRKLNFSKKYTLYDILTVSRNLESSIRPYEATPQRVEVGSDLPYAQVHNEGGYIRVFGKARVRLPQRQFIGESHELMEELEDKLMKKIDQITNNNI